MSNSILYFRNGIGNLIQATPAMQALSITLREKIDICLDSDWFLTPVVEDIISRYFFIDKIVKYPFVEKTHYKNWIYFGHNERTPTFDLFKSKSKINCDDLKFFDGNMMSEVQYYMAVARRWGYSQTLPTPSQFCPHEGNIEMVDIDVTGPIVALCNGGSGYFRAVKQWNGFYELATELMSSGLYVVLLGREGELKDVPCNMDLTGKLSFTHSCHVLSQSNFIVTTDTAMMHAADALMLKGIALFGATSIVKNGPVNGTLKVMASDIECRPCQHKGSGFNTCRAVYCMNTINYKDVYRKVLSLL